MGSKLEEHLAAAAKVGMSADELRQSLAWALRPEKEDAGFDEIPVHLDKVFRRGLRKLARKTNRKMWEVHQEAVIEYLEKHKGVLAA